MDEIEKGEFYNFDKKFKDLPVENRVKLIKTAKCLWEVQKVTKENAPLPYCRNGVIVKEVYDGKP